MPPRRILSLWFLRLSVEHARRRLGPEALDAFATTLAINGAITLASLTPSAELQGLRQGMSRGFATGGSSDQRRSAGIWSVA